MTDVERLTRSVETLTDELEEKQAELTLKNSFLDLIASDVGFYETNYGRASERMRKIVDAYRECREKGESLNEPKRH